MKTFEELFVENIVTVELDHAGDSKEIKEFMAKAKAFKPKTDNNWKDGRPYQVVSLTGDFNKLYDWVLKNYDNDIDKDDFQNYIV